MIGSFSAFLAAKAVFIYNHHIEKKRIKVKYYIGRHKTLTDILLIAQAVKCKVSISNKKAKVWVFYVESRNVSQTSIAYI